MITKAWNQASAFLYRKIMKRPDFLGIGAQRSGTTWLYQMLARHPDIFLTSQKELHFFDEKPDFSGYEGVWNPLRQHYYDLDSATDWLWYLRQFGSSEKGQIKGEITPLYATLSVERVKIISQKLPRLKIIYILRNPVQRAWSNLRFSWKNHTRTREGELTEDIVRKTIFYPAKLIHGDYRRNIQTWEMVFSRDAILYLFYDDIVEKPGKVLEQVCSFLKVAPLGLEGAALMEKVNESPERQMPGHIRELLEEYYARQMAFVKNRFGRILHY
jgi:hypothetical protein